MKRFAIVLILLLAGCSSLTRYEGTGSSSASAYVVRAGDTLYSIAWRHGLNADDLARWNNLRDPGRIYVGQRLVLVPGASRVATSASAPSRSPPPPPPPPPRQAAPGFGWPVTGPVVSRFGEQGLLTTGIGIGGRRGQDIVAAAAGRVIYAGTGGADYGQLIVIEHNDNWLTTYGYNEGLFVAEDQLVTRGQKIAEMGLGPERVPSLYFEIRRDGNPLDPLSFLP